MADDIDEQVTAHICEILRLVLDVKGRSLRNVNELVGQTSKFELQPITNVHPEVMIVQNYHIEIGQGEASSLPICVEFKHLRRSNRLPPTKRDYRKMQSPSSGTGRLPKKLKLADNDCLTDSLPTEGLFNEPATDGSTGETPTEPFSEHPSKTPTNASATGTPATSEPANDKSSANCTNTAEALDFSGTDASSIQVYLILEGSSTLLGIWISQVAILNLYFDLACSSGRGCIQGREQGLRWGMVERDQSGMEFIIRSCFLRIFF